LNTRDTRCAVLGAGPIGLEAALYAAALGMDVTVYEAGGEAASGVRGWGHVEMFSPFSMNHAPLGTALLEREGQDLPDEDAYQTGEEYAETYLRPLSELSLLEGRVRYGARVVSAGKEGLGKSDLIGQEARLERPFRLLLEEEETERIAHADLVLDCTGLYGNPNWLGSGGIPAIGERALRDQIVYGLPDVLGRDREVYAGKVTLLAGDGYSAATTLFGLLDLAREEPDTRVVWLTNHDREPRYEVIEDDALSQRAALIEEANRVSRREDDESLEQVTGASVERIGTTPEGEFRVELGGGARREISVDQIVANVGFSPDNSIYQELQIHECYASRGPMSLTAALLGAGGGADCLAVPPLGPETLKNPEPGFFIIGSKSYGKGFNFLLRNGLDQVQDALGLVTGRADLDLYEPPSGIFPYLQGRAL
jgi:Pyridine nucleotide-disulphide oxidoreductase